MNDPARGPTVALIPLEAERGARMHRLATAVAASGADYVLPAPPELQATDVSVAMLRAAAAADPEALAFQLSVRGLSGEPAWRGRRCRAHERNLESLRFANLIAPGALMARREALLSAMVGLPPGSSEDAWRLVCRRIARAGRIAQAEVPLRRTRRMEGEPRCPSFAPPGGGRVLVLGQIEVSTSLYFDFLEASAEISVDFRQFSRLAIDAPALAGANLVILVRELHRFWDEGVIAFLEAAGVPWVWFTDDNFQVLRKEGGAPSFYSAERMREALAGAAEVWASTEPLAAALGPLHERVRVWGPVLDPALAAFAPTPGEALTIAIAGGDFRLSGLEGAPLARLRALSERQSVRLVMTPAAAAHLQPKLPRAELISLRPERSFRQFVRAWRRWRPDILLHPAGETANAPFKCPTAAITAHYLSAVPVVADEAAYADWSFADGLVRLGADGEGLNAAAQGARTAWRADMASRLARALGARCNDAGRAARLESLARAAEFRDAAAEADRVLTTPAVGRRLFRLGLARQWRRLSG
ncbi:MAG TPA: hypothetical protein VFE13_16715 [Caulobacteraceae bacterium]|jgi:hypothetical protein|nr:hypothetical protein [Caulobacteraceae bacterium]